MNEDTTDLSKVDLEFKATPVSARAARGKIRYQGWIQHNLSLDRDEFAAAYAKKMGVDVSESTYCLSALRELVEGQLRAGNRVDLGWVSFGLKMEGTVDGEDGKFDSERNRISVSVKCGKSFNACAEGIVPRNVKTSFTACIDSTSQRGVKLSPKMFDRICRSGGVVTVAGMNIAIDVDNPDEGAWLEQDGKIAAVGRVEKSDAQICEIRFDTFPPPGKYDLVLACRNNRPPTTVVKKVRHAVTVVETDD